MVYSYDGFTGSCVIVYDTEASWYRICTFFIFHLHWSHAPAKGQPVRIFPVDIHHTCICIKVVKDIQRYVPSVWVNGQMYKPTDY